jgi:hypothetical protein
MFKKVARRVYSCLAFVSLGCASLVAQTPPIVHSRRSPMVTPANRPDPGLVKIYSNLGPKTDAYDSGISWLITGAGNPLFGKGYLAMPFTPAENSTAHEVLIALGYQGGGINQGSIGIFTDSNGTPDQPLKIWTAANFPAEGTCCPLVTLKDRDGIALEGGTQFWVVAASGPGQNLAQYQWNFVWKDGLGNLAFLNGNTDDKWLAYGDNVAAFAVYGTIP